MLGALKDFYHSEGDGIREEDLKTDAYNVRCLEVVHVHCSMFLIPKPIPETLREIELTIQT